VLSERRELPAGTEPVLQLGPGETTRSERLRMNDRAIELSLKRHVELVLYARGLEIERDRLLHVIREAHERLAGVTRTSEMTPELRKAAGHAVRELAKWI
jgi:hypothetical protein